MRRGFWWKVALPIAIGALLSLCVFGGDHSPDAQMVACPGYVLAVGPLDAAEHEHQEGFFNVGKFSISVPPAGIPAAQLRLLLGKDVEIVIRESRRELKKLDR